MLGLNPPGIEGSWARTPKEQRRAAQLIRIMSQHSKKMDDETALPSLRSYNLWNEAPNIHDGVNTRRR